jgi:hypothetical protein
MSNVTYSYTERYINQLVVGMECVRLDTNCLFIPSSQKEVTIPFLDFDVSGQKGFEGLVCKTIASKQ